MTRIGTFVRNHHNRNWFCVAIIVLFCFLSFALPLLMYGLPSGFDMLTDIQFATAFQDVISSGHVFPSWANDNFGYGSVGIRFYPPLSFILLAVTHLITNDWFTTFVTNAFLWMLVGSVGMYFFVKEWGTPMQGLLAAILYAVVPQHLAEIFQFFMFGEFAAWAVLPFCFLFVTRICRGGTWIDTALFALFYSLLILIHLPTTIIVSLCLPIYVLFLIDWHNFKRIFIQLLSAIALTLLATSFRWVMLVSELNWLAHNGQEHYASGYYDFSLWLFPNVLASRSLFVYVMTSWLFDIAIVLTVALTIPALICLLRGYAGRNNSVQRVLIASLVTALFAFFMLSRPSYYLWSNITFLQKLQFPWRWLSILSMLCVVLFTLSVPHLMSRFRKFERFVAYPALALVVAIMLFDITQIIIPSAPVPSAEMAQIEERLTTQPIWKGWWPIWAKEKAFDNTERVIAASRKVDITNWTPESKEFVVQPGQPVSVGVQTFYYPRWKATVNGRASEIGMDENGAITIPVSGEVSRVHLYFEEPLIIKGSYVVSSVIWLLGFCLMYVIYGRKYIPSMSSKPLFDEEYDYS